MVERFAADAGLWLTLRGEVARRRAVRERCRIVTVECAYSGNEEYFDALLDAGHSPLLRSFVAPLAPPPYRQRLNLAGARASGREAGEQTLAASSVFTEPLPGGIDCVMAAQMGRRENGSKGWIHGRGFQGNSKHSDMCRTASRNVEVWERNAQSSHETVVAKKKARKKRQEADQRQQQLFAAMAMLDYQKMLELIEAGASASATDPEVRTVCMCMCDNQVCVCVSECERV